MPEKHYSLYFPQIVKFGNGIINSLAEIVPKSGTALLITGNSSKNNGLLTRLQKILQDHHYVTVCGITAEPPLHEVDKLIQLGRKKQCSSIIAVGGGSVIDAAKAAAIIIPAEGKCTEYFYGKREINKPGIPLFAAPTTAGTGAEISKNSVLSDPDKEIKKSIRHPFMVPFAALIDPELTVSCPPELTAASGFDALTQAIESYTSPNANNLTRPIAAQAVKQIFSQLENVYLNGQDIVARTLLAEGSMLSAMAFSQTGLGAVHGLAHPIGIRLNRAHGLVCAILLPTIMTENLAICRQPYAELAGVCKFDNPESWIDAIRRLAKEINIPERLAEIGMGGSDIPFITVNCRSGSMQANPRKFSDAEIEQILVQLS